MNKIALHSYRWIIILSISRLESHRINIKKDKALKVMNPLVSFSPNTPLALPLISSSEREQNSSLRLLKPLYHQVRTPLFLKAGEQYFNHVAQNRLKIKEEKKAWGQFIAQNIEPLISQTSADHIQQQVDQKTRDMLEAKWSIINAALAGNSQLLEQTLSLTENICQNLRSPELKDYFQHSCQFELVSDDANEAKALAQNHAQINQQLSALKQAFDTQLCTGDFDTVEMEHKLGSLNDLVSLLQIDIQQTQKHVNYHLVPMTYSALMNYAKAGNKEVGELKIKGLLLTPGNEIFFSKLKAFDINSSERFIKNYVGMIKTLLARQQPMPPIPEDNKIQLTVLLARLSIHQENIVQIKAQIADPEFSTEEGYDRFEHKKVQVYRAAYDDVAQADDLIWSLIQVLPTRQQLHEEGGEFIHSTDALRTDALKADVTQRFSSPTHQEQKAASSIQQAWRNYQADPFKVYLASRPLSRGTLWKKMRSFLTEGKPAHVSTLVSKGFGREIKHIFTAQETAANDLSISHPSSGVATRDKAAWKSKAPSVITSLLPFPAVLFERATLSMKDRDSALGQANMRSRYVDGFTFHRFRGRIGKAPSNCQTHVFQALNELAGLANLRTEYLLQNGLVSYSGRTKLITSEDLKLPEGIFRLGSKL